MNATCPECETTISFTADIIKGKIVKGTACGAELEVTNVIPVQLELAPTEEEEDWGG